MVAHSRPGTAAMSSSGPPALRLGRQPSKLHLIDNTTLTSLPFAPPLKTKSKLKESRERRGSNSHGADVAVHTRSTPTKNCGNAKHHRPANSNDSSFTSLETLTTANMTTEFDESFDDAEEPIVLVEDYMASQGTDTMHSNKIMEHTRLFRQRSLANFKQRLLTRGDLATGKRSASNDTLFDKPDENLEEIFGKLPGTSLLKHCDICDKPLYEISSIISNKRQKMSAESYKLPNSSSKVDELFDEFICGECIEVYEDFLNELYENETTAEMYQNPTDEARNLRLLHIFREVQHRAAFTTSNSLIQKLKFLNSVPGARDSGGLTWIASLQAKLRWRWRLNGLIPQFKRKNP